MNKDSVIKKEHTITSVCDRCSDIIVNGELGLIDINVD